MKEQIPKIEILPWVKFNTKDGKAILEKIAKDASSKMDFISKARAEFGLSISEVNVITDKFYKK